MSSPGGRDPRWPTQGRTDPEDRSTAEDLPRGADHFRAFPITEVRVALPQVVLEPLRRGEDRATRARDPSRIVERPAHGTALLPFPSRPDGMLGVWPPENVPISRSRSASLGHGGDPFPAGSPERIWSARGSPLMRGPPPTFAPAAVQARPAGLWGPIAPWPPSSTKRTRRTSRGTWPALRSSLDHRGVFSAPS